MTEAIDVHDLPENEVRFVKELVELLREKKQETKKDGEASEEINFATWPLRVKGKLTREEIYDHL